MLNKVRRQSLSGQLPVNLEQPFFDTQSSDTTDDEVDSHLNYHTRDSNSPGRCGSGPKMEQVTSSDMFTPRGRPKRPWRRKRRCSNTKEETGQTMLGPDLSNSKQALLSCSTSQSPSHTPTLTDNPFQQQQTTPPREYNNSSKVNHPASGESTPRLISESHELPITEKGDVSPAVAQFLESIKHPPHMHSHGVRRSSSNGSLRTHRRQGSNCSTHSYNVVPSPLSASPVKGPSQCNSSSSLSKSRRAPLIMDHISPPRGLSSGVQYSKLDSSSSGEEDKEHETGTQSSDHNTTTTTTSDGQLLLLSRLKPIRSQTNEVQSLSQQRSVSPSRELYSNESSGEARCSDGGHDADGESDGNSLDLLSELEPNESNLESLHSPSNVEESSDVTSTTPDIQDSYFASSSLAPKVNASPLHSSRNNVAMLITQFETTSSDLSELANCSDDHYLPEQPEIPAHIKRDVAIPLAGSYSPKSVEDLLEGGWLLRLVRNIDTRPCTMLHRIYDQQKYYVLSPIYVMRCKDIIQRTQG